MEILAEIKDVLRVPKSPLRQWQLITLHHSGNVPIGIPLLGDWIDRIHKAGEREGYPPFENGMGYHFLINRNGAIEYGERWKYQIYGAHNNARDENGRSYNHTSIGICLAGNYSKELPNKVQFDIARKLISALSLKVYPHFYFKSTECPGKLFDGARAWLKEINPL